MSELKEKIYAKMQQPTLAVLATITEDGKPWVRYCTPRFDENLTIWIATFIHSRKVGQIKKNPEVHLTVGITTMETAESYLQIQGRAEILTDAESKKAIWFPPLENIFSGPEDPNYCVLKISPYRIEYQTMAMTPAEVWEP
jgi:general stress protein 26